MNDANDSVRRDSLAVTGQRLVQLRWWLLAGLALAALAAPTLLDIALPWPPLLMVLALMAAFNLAARRSVGAAGFGATTLTVQLAVDLVGMGVMLYLTGGAANPLVLLLLLPVAVAALSLPGRHVAGISVLAVVLYSLLMLFSLPLPIADGARAARLHLGGMWLTFVVSAVLIAWFVTRLTALLRERDARLTAARELALRDAQVVALGQLAAGAAHELGTPLATMSILAGELGQDARLPADARDDLALLRRQIAICKDIIGGLTRKTGIARADVAPGVPLDHWLQGLLARWRALWPEASCSLEMAGAGEVPLMAADAGAIEQAINNLLNNAARSAPNGIRLVVSWDDKTLRLAVHDRGSGFPPAILSCGGAQPVPAHEQGAGIGLWLTRSAVERVGGRMHIENSTAGGVATIELPLTASCIVKGKNGAADPGD